jgi:hypothetical protein
MKCKAAAGLCVLLLAIMMTACNAKPSGDQTAVSNKPTASPQITTGTDTPQGFPSDIPMATDAKITSSMKRADTDRVTYTVAYDTKMKIEDVRTLYVNFLQNNAYQDVSNMGSTHTAILSGTLDGGKKNLSVSVMDKQDSLQVTIQYIAPPQ